MKRVTLTLLIATLLSVASAFAQDCDYSGTTGTLQWCLKNGTLTISGEGAMPDYEVNNVPWYGYGYTENIHTVIIENGVTTIGNYAFRYCRGLTSATIPSSITRIGTEAFSYCVKLPSIIIPDGVTSIEYGTFAICESLTSVVIPNSVTIISDYAFDACINLPSITIPNSVISIGKQAFVFCWRLASITLSNKLTDIGDTAFGDCASLISITIPNSVKKIGHLPFLYCYQLTSIDVESENVKYSSDNGILFDKNQNTLIWCPAKNEIGAYIVPENVTKIMGFAFDHCTGLTSIIIPNGVRDIDSRVFDNCTNLTSVILSNSITRIRYATFLYCTSLTSITIPNGVTRIDADVFCGCINLRSIIIPKSLKHIEGSIFYNCKNLTSITNNSPVPCTIYPDVFEGMTQSTCMLKVPNSAVTAYQNADVWKEFNVIGGGIAVNTKANEIDFGYTINEGLYEVGDNVNVIAIPNDGYEFVNWTKNGEVVSTKALYDFTVTEDVELVANFKKGEVGIDPVGANNYSPLRVYPNPTRGELRIMNNEQLTMNNVEIYDVLGRLVFISPNPSEGGELAPSPLERDGVRLNVSHLPAGIYFLRIGNKTAKFVKQ